MGGNPNAIGRRRDAQYMLRMPSGLRERIAAAAKANARSLNTEIVLALEAAFPKPVEPETVNEALLDASRSILADWTRTLKALGQSVDDNPRVVALLDAISRAENLP